MLTEPHIDLALLGRVNAPVLVMSGDHDLIRLQHTVAIFEALPNAQLAVVPNNTHMLPYDNPTVFNAAVEQFLQAPFKKIDRLPATVSSLEKMMAGVAK